MPQSSVTLVGNLTADPELRFLTTGTGLATFRLAVSHRRPLRGKSGEFSESTSFFDVTCLGDLAEHVGESLSKGHRAVVYGRLEQQQWETPEGERRSRVQALAGDVAPSLRWTTVEVKRTQRRQSAPPPGDVPPDEAFVADLAGALNGHS